MSRPCDVFVSWSCPIWQSMWTKISNTMKYSWIIQWNNHLRIIYLSCDGDKTWKNEAQYTCTKKRKKEKQYKQIKGLHNELVLCHARPIIIMNFDKENFPTRNVWRPNVPLKYLLTSYYIKLVYDQKLRLEDIFNIQANHK